MNTQLHNFKAGDKVEVIRDYTSFTTDPERYAQRGPQDRIQKGEIITLTDATKYFERYNGREVEDEDQYVYYASAGGYPNRILYTHVKPWVDEKKDTALHQFRVGDIARVIEVPSGSYAPPKGKQGEKLELGDQITVTGVELGYHHSCQLVRYEADVSNGKSNGIYSYRLVPVPPLATKESPPMITDTFKPGDVARVLSVPCNNCKPPKGKIGNQKLEIGDTVVITRAYLASGSQPMVNYEGGDQGDVNGMFASRFVLIDKDKATSPSWNPHGFQEGDWAEVVSLPDGGKPAPKGKWWRLPFGGLKVGDVVQIHNIQDKGISGYPLANYDAWDYSPTPLRLHRFVPTQPPTPSPSIVPTVLSTILVLGLGVSNMQSFMNDPVIVKCVEALIAGCTAFVLGNMGLYTTRRAGTMLAAFGKHRREIRREKEEATNKRDKDKFLALSKAIKEVESNIKA